MTALPSVQELIAQRGTTFGNAIVPIPLCCPARASLVTGQYPHNHGVTSNNNEDGGGFDGMDQTNTLARWLHDAGYRTAPRRQVHERLRRGQDPPDRMGRVVGRLGEPVPDVRLHAQPQRRGDGVRDHAERLQDGCHHADQPGVRRGHGSRGGSVLPPGLVHRPSRRAGDGQPRPALERQRARPAPGTAALSATAPMPRDPSFSEADVTDKPQWLRELPEIGAGRTGIITGKYRTATGVAGVGRRGRQRDHRRRRVRRRAGHDALRVRQRQRVHAR